MSAVLADTHVIIWYLFEPAQLSASARIALRAAVNAGSVIYISAISIVEVIYLIEKGKLPSTTYIGILAAIDDPATPIQVLAVDAALARSADRVPRAIVPDLPDRIIATTGLVHGLPLVTADRKIRAAPLPTIW